MKYLVYLRRGILFIAMSLLLAIVFFLSYYHPNIPNETKLLSAAHSSISTDKNVKSFVDGLKEPVSPLFLKPEEFKKTGVFE